MSTRSSHITLPPPKKGPDRFFLALTATSGWLIVAVIAFIAVFLVATALPALAKNEANFFTSTMWQVGETLQFGIANLLWTTVISSVLAMAIAVPIAVGVALLITQYVKGRIAGVVGFLVDLLAAVPSVIYGLWGAAVLAPAIDPVSKWMQANLGWIPLFAPGLQSSGTVFVASLVLAIMILPIVTSISRDVFAQTPRDHIEAAWALGATKWEMISMAVIPYGRSGVVAASMLGLGRALGETIAVMLILSTTNDLAINVSLFAGGETFASKIANNAAEFDSPTKTGAYIAAGMVLFVVTFVVNAAARTIVDRRKVK
ncbi:MAG: phosphate ABC transporter permease subunit PstC [Propionibacteriaceae bacterium]|nr:phosphate ABC transporter permease subunit PstC [Propionibacteriaceae bacterium]